MTERTKGRRYGGLGASEDGVWYTTDVCAECQTELNGGDGSVRRMNKEQRCKREGLEIQPLGDW